MRRLFAFNMVSVDGFFEGPGQDISWHTTDEDFNQFAIEQTRSIDAILFGRVTYQGMASYWPTDEAIAADPAIAELMNTLPKIVFSRTLEKADWRNSKLVKNNAAEEILALKQQPGKDMAIFGSANLISSIMDVIDEHRVMISPVLLRAGTPLFKSEDVSMRLRLSNARIFDSGNVLLSYQPIRSLA